MIDNFCGAAPDREPGDPASSVSPARRVTRRTDGYVVLDSSWARRLGIRRSGGRYRITRRELIARLQAASAPQHDDHATPATHSHSVAFYETEAFLVDSVREFLAPGLLTGDAAIVVASDTHRELFDRALTHAGIDIPAARRSGRYLDLDTSEALATLMVDGTSEPARFTTGIGQLITQAANSAPEVRIYGEMIAALWDQGNITAAIALEDHWNDLATRYPFSLFCTYPIRAFDLNPDGFHTICKQHSKVLHQPQGT